MEIHRTIDINGVDITDTCYANAREKIVEWGEKRQHRYVCVCNVHSVTQSKWDARLKLALDNSDMNTADGMPLVWMQKKMGVLYARRVYGPTLMKHILWEASTKKLKIAFYGGHKDRLPQLIDFVSRFYPKVEIVEHISPPFRELTETEDQFFTDRLIKSEANIIFVGIGCPKQEIWMHNHSHRIPGVMIGVGAAFDFLPGFVDQAPSIIQRLGFEWAYRLYKEPKRLFKRYMTTNPVFILFALKQLFSRKVLNRNYIHNRIKEQDQNDLPEINTISICIATYNRPQQLEDLLHSIKDCRIPHGIKYDIRIVDNDADESAREVVERFSKRYGYKFKTSYTVVPKQNIAIARNVAIEQGESDAYIFVDDDEIVHYMWLWALTIYAEKHKVAAVFGSVYPVLEEDSVYKPFFYKNNSGPLGEILDWSATRTSNTIVRGEWFNKKGYRFDEKLGKSGGSDSDLFARMSTEGATYLSCPMAIVKEFIPKERANMKWLLKRFYRNGLVYERNKIASQESNYPLLRAIKRFGSIIYFLLKFRFRYALCKCALLVGGLTHYLKPLYIDTYVEYKEKQSSDAHEHH